MPNEIKAIILDKDGVFVNFDKLWGRIIVYRSETIKNKISEILPEDLKQTNIDHIKNDSMRVMGLNPSTGKFDPSSPGSCMPFEYVKTALASALFINMTKIIDSFSWNEAFEIIEQSTEEIKREYNIVEMSEPIEGVNQKIKEIYEAKYKLAVLTSDTFENAVGAVKKFGIDRCFLKIQSGRKKTPELYLQVCSELKVNPKETLMFGDTPMELASAKQCGAMTIGLLSGVVNEENKSILEKHSDFVLNSLAEFDLKTIGNITQDGNNNITQKAQNESNKKRSKKMSHLGSDTVVIFSDGASRGNPGESSVGVILEEEGSPVSKISKVLGIATNNEAEYQAMIAGLEEAQMLGYKRVIANADSELLVKQLNGEYKVKSDNVKPLYKRILELISQFEHVEFHHISRASNWRADKLANEALDQLV